jgi:hypothetical protein
MMIPTIATAFVMLFFTPLISEEPTPEPSFFSKMDQRSRRATGIFKLSAAEKIALESWITTGSINVECEIASLTGEPLLLTTKTGDVYEVAARFAKRTMSWRAGDKVYIVQSKKPIWYRIQHSVADSTIGVKKICPTTSQNQ